MERLSRYVKLYLVINCITTLCLRQSLAGCMDWWYIILRSNERAQRYTLIIFPAVYIYSSYVAGVKYTVATGNTNEDRQMRSGALFVLSVAIDCGCMPNVVMEGTHSVPLENIYEDYDDQIN
jgi:hypothetical protein